MRIGVLGPLQVVGDDGEVVLTAPKERALVQLLALQPGREVSLDHLVAGLWGERPPATARRAVQTHVSNLRRQLPARLIKTAPHGYSLAVEPDAVDLYRFEALIAEGRAAAAAGQPDSAVAALVDGLALWRGEPVADLAQHMPGRVEQVRLQELRSEAEEDLFAVRLALGQHHMVVPDLEAAVAAEPLREHRWAQLMLALYRCGRQAEALRAFARVRRTLTEELGIDPGDELQTLERAVLDQSPDLVRPTTGPGEVTTQGGDPATRRADRAPAIDGATRSRSDGLPAALLRSLGSAPLVGRLRELRRAEQAWVDATLAPPGVLVLTGPAGIGKTRLAAELSRILHESGGVVLYGRWDEELLRPMQALAEALTGFLMTMTSRDVATAVRESGIELMWLLPELAARHPDLGPLHPASGEADRFRLFEAVVSMVRRVAADRPVLMVLDDVQWADPPSLPMLRHLTNATFANPLMLVLTHRTDNLQHGSPSPLLAGLARDHPIARLAVGGLGGEDVRGLVRSLCPDRPLAARLTPRLNQITEGNPFFVIQLVKHLLEIEATDLVGSSAGVALSVPDEVHTLLERRLSLLSAATIRALRAAAVIGFEWDIDLLAEAHSASPDDVVDLMEEAISAGVVVESPTAVDRCRFGHALLHEVVYAQLPASRRRRLHLAVAQALERRGTRLSNPADLAHHLLEAHPLGDIDRTVEVAEQAATAAASAAAYEQAAALLERALAVLSGSDPSPERVASMLLALGHAHAAAGDSPRARDAFWRAFDAARAAGSARLLADAALGAGGEWVSLSTHDADLEGVLTKALAAVGDTSPSLEARLLARLASARFFASDVEEAGELSRRAVDLARRSGDPGATASALHSHHLVLRAGSPPQLRLDVAREVVSKAVEAGDVPRALVGHADAVFDLLESGDFHAADHEANAYQELARSAGRHFDTWWLAVHRTMRALVEGRWVEADSLSLEALRLGETFDQPDPFTIYAAQLFALRWGQGRLAELRKEIEALAAASPGLVAWRAALAVVLTEDGCDAEARALLHAIIPSALEAAPKDGLWVATLALASHAAVTAGDPATCQFLLDALAPFAGRVALLGPGVVSMGAVDGYRGMAAATTGDWSTAHEAFASAEQLNNRIGAKPWEALTLLDHARLLIAYDSNQTAAAVEMATRATVIASELPMPAVFSVAQHLLAEAGALS